MGIASVLFLLSWGAPAAETAPPAKEKVSIGLVFPNSGVYRQHGENFISGIMTALNKIDSRNGVRSDQIKFFIKDNRGSAEESVRLVKELIEVNKVSIIIGPLIGHHVLEVAIMVQQARIPLVTPTASNFEIDLAGDFIFKIPFSDIFQGEAMAKFARDTLRKRRVAIVTDEGSPYSSKLVNSFISKFTHLGGRIVPVSFSYSHNDESFLPLLEEISIQKPDAIFLPGYYSEAGPILRQAREMGIDVPFLGGDGWDGPRLQELAGPEGIKGNYIVSHFTTQDEGPEVQSFVQAYTREFNVGPSLGSALAYDAMMLVSDALNRAADWRPDSIQKAMRETGSFAGATGTITVDFNGNFKKEAFILETTPEGMSFRERVAP